MTTPPFALSLSKDETNQCRGLVLRQAQHERNI